jgi:glycosyltransferase involved in cell wall biosynthesis
VRILILQSELGVLRGGGENFTRNLFDRLSRRGHRISAAFVAGPSARYPVGLPAGISAEPLSGWWSRRPGQVALSSIARRLRSGSTATTGLDRVVDAVEWRGTRWHDRRFHRRVFHRFSSRWDAFDAVYVHGNVELAADVARYRPTILRLPGPVSEDKGALLRRVHAVCANGDALGRLRAFMGDLVLEVPLGLDFKVFSPGPSTVCTRLGWTRDHRVFGYVGRLTRLKGVDLLAQAFHQVAAACLEARLVIIGSGELEPSVRHVLAGEIDAGIVHMTGGLDTRDLVPWYRAMDCFLLPSRYENFSNALLEAAACGVRFVASDIGGNRMFVESGAAGDLFTPGSVPDMVLEMRKVISSRDGLRAEAALRVPLLRERYSWEASADCLEGILERQTGVKSAPDGAAEGPRPLVTDMNVDLRRMP